MCDILKHYIDKGRAIGFAEGERKGKRKGERKGEDRMSRLITLLINDNRIDDIVRVGHDPAFRKKILIEFGLINPSVKIKKKAGKK